MEKVYERAGWTLLVGLSNTLTKSVIYCIYHFVHKIKDIILYGKGWGSPKYNEGNPRVFFFLYNYRQAWCAPRPFFRLSLCNIIVRRTISSYNKDLCFLGWRKHRGVSNAWHGLVGCELFMFHLVSMNYEIILTYELFHVMNVLLFISVKFPQSYLSNECFN